MKRNEKDLNHKFVKETLPRFVMPSQTREDKREKRLNKAEKKEFRKEEF